MKKEYKLVPKIVLKKYNRPKKWYAIYNIGILKKIF